MAYYDWQDETQLVKQSLMSLIGMLGGIIVIALLGAVANVGAIPLDAKLITTSINVFILALTAIVYLHERNRPIRE